MNEGPVLPGLFLCLNSLEYVEFWTLHEKKAQKAQDKGDYSVILVKGIIPTI